MIKYTDVRSNDDGTYSCVNGVPNNPKRMTAGRFAKIIGSNPWGTPFQAWCEIMRTVVPPFEDNKYTIAGKVIEPKLIEFAKQAVSPYIQDPEQYYGVSDAKQHKRYEFFDDNDIFGGMWDGLAFEQPNVRDSSNVDPIAVIECKTTSRPQDWADGVPDNYKAQGLLYANLLGVHDVYFIVAFLEPSDYDDPSAFDCTDDNTRVYCVDVDEPFAGYEDIDHAMFNAEKWWDTYVYENVSPVADSKKDSEYLKLIHQCDICDLRVESEVPVETLVLQLGQIDDKISALELEHGIDELKAQRKAINSSIQSTLKPSLLAIDDKDSVTVGEYVFTVSHARKVDYAALERDEILEKYVTLTPTIKTKRTQKNG